MPKAAAKVRRYIKAKSRGKPAALVAKVDKRARFSDELKAQAVALAREGKVTREIGTTLGLDKAQWQNIRLWTERANVDLPKERKRGPRKGGGGAAAKKSEVKALYPRARKLVEPHDPLSSILDLLENPSDAVATLEVERSKAAQRLATIDKLLAVLRSGH
jgi:transposase-like protein